MTRELETFSWRDTAEAGKRLAADIRQGQVVALLGDLGVGKTVFTQGFAEGLGVLEPVCSPTFTIIQEYDSGRLPFYHFDVYRIGSPEEMYDIGFEEYVDGDGVCLIEWANLVEEVLPPEYLRVTISKDLDRGFDYRRILIEEVTS